MISVKLKKRKKYRLKKSVINYLFILLLSALIIFMQQSKILKPLFKRCEEKYLKELYVTNTDNLKSKITNKVFKEIDLSIPK